MTPAPMTRELYLKRMSTLVRKLKRLPSNDEMNRAGITRNMMQYHFGNFERLEDALRAAYPQLFWDEPLAKVIEADPNLDKYQRFILTTAVVGCRAHEPFIKALESYAAKNRARILVLACADPAAEVSRGGYGAIDQVIAKSEHTTIVGADVQLHPHLSIRTIKTSAKQLDPTTGITRVGRRGGSCVYASPKQRLEFVAASVPGKLPHAVMTTGACTKANYRSGLYMSQRLAYLAEHDHIIGAVVVELDGELFHFRQVQARGDGSFCDLGQRYSADGSIAAEAPVAMVWGDTHVGATDEQDEAARREMVEALHPETVFLHDLFDGKSISHHELKKSITRARSIATLPLETELGKVADYLKSWIGEVKLVVVKSNHDEWLERYLEECRFKDEPQNYGVGLALALAMFEGKDPLATAMAAEDVKGVRFLTRRDSVRVAKIELGQHGDKGPNGGASSLAGMEQAYGSCVIGHSHAPAILRGVYRVGTSTRLDLGYNVGPSSWFHTHCLVYGDGSRQLVNTIDGRWRASKR